MDPTGIVAYRKKLEQVVGKYSDFLGDQADSLCREHSVPVAEKLQADLASIADEERLLKIGIVGRVKSGKSSLLNAFIFGGDSILPKAATPMTAALTTISHGETESAEVEFFTREDVAEIKGQYEEYNRQYQRRLKQLLAEEKKGNILSRSRKSPEERARSKVEREMRQNVELSAAHEQYTKIIDRGVSIESLENHSLLKFDDLADLQRQLDDYVGADGQYMPFTKSVNIRLPQENLKDIEIVDTPGINDPVQSREERTREHLSRCDVVLVVSPAGQFMSQEDLDLMDRITSKKGIRQLFAVAAQADLQLFGNLLVENDGKLDRVLNSLTVTLGSHLQKVIAELKKRNPEVGDSYDQLLDDQREVIHSSGICESMKQRFQQKDEWDEGMRHTWDKLQRAYPDYFSAADERLSSGNLAKLSNIAAIRGVVEQVRAQKPEILKKKIDDYAGDNRGSLQALGKGLLSYVNERQGEIESTDIEGIRARREELTAALNGAATDIQLDYKESIEKVSSDLTDVGRQALRNMHKSLGDNITKGTGESVERIKEEGLGGWWRRVIGKGGYKRVTHTTIRTNAVSHELSRFSRELTDFLIKETEDAKKKWRNDLIGSMTRVLRENLNEDHLEASRIRRGIRTAVNSISIPEFKYEKPLPKSLRHQGVLKGEEADEFIQDAVKHIDSLEKELDKKIKEYGRALAADMQKVQLEKRLLEQFQKDLTSLEQSIANKEMELKRIGLLKDELERIEGSE